MADLYRKSSLDKLSNPEQLDRMIKISSPLSWLALVAVLIVIIATLIWSVAGTLPSTETVNGMIVYSDSVNAAYSDFSGVLEEYSVEVGEKVSSGDEIAKARHADGTVKSIKAELDGVLSAYSLETGSKILAGTEIARITPENTGSQVVVCYVPLVYAGKFETGMKVLVYPSSVDSQKYGHMEAEIVSVDEYAANTDSLAYVFGSGNMVSQLFASEGPVVSIVCKIRTDKETKSGFYWSGDNGKELTVSNATVVSAKIIVDECAPITKFIGKFKDNVEG